MTKHELKIWSNWWKLIYDKVKNFEIRKNDRNFKIGDMLILREYNNGKYTGNECLCRIWKIEDDVIGLKSEYVLLFIDNLHFYYTN